MRRFSSLSGPVCGGCCQTSRNTNGGVNASCSRKPAVPSFDCDRALPPAHESRAMPAMAQTRARKYLEIIVPSRIVLNNARCAFENPIANTCTVHPYNNCALFATPAFQASSFRCRAGQCKDKECIAGIRPMDFGG